MAEAPGRPPTRADRERAVRAYAAHLCAGGGETWGRWRAHLTGQEPFDATGPRPGGAQLEVVRRLVRLPAADLPGLADLVLHTPAPGRGRVEAPLPWPGLAEPPGPAPVAPDRLPDDELLRVCLGVLSDLCCRLVAADPGPAPVPWRRAVARRLRRSRGPVVLQGGPLELMMAQRWTEGVAAGEGVGWPRLWRRAEARGRLPGRVDLAGRARRAAERHGAGRVVVRLDAEPPQIGSPDLVGVDLWCRLNPVLAHRALDGGAVARVLRRLLVPDEPAVRTLSVPEPQRAWAQGRARRMADRLTRGAETAGYAVHGDPEVLRRGVDGPRRIPVGQTLALAVRACDRAWQEVNR